MRTITFAIQKGGTGKTSISVSTAVQLAKLNKKTLLIDADPQGNATTWLNVLNLQNEFADVLLDKIEVQDAIIKTQIDNLYLLPTAGIGGELKNYCDNSVRFAKVQKILKSLQDTFDFCVIDTSPSFGNFERSIIRATDEVIPVLKLDEFSKDGFQIFVHRFQDCIKNDCDDDKEIELSKIVLSSKDDRILQQTKNLKVFEDLQMNLFLVPIDQAFPKAQELHKPIQDLQAKKQTIETIEKLAGAINGNL